MKIIILSFFISLQIFAQKPLSTLFDSGVEPLTKIANLELWMQYGDVGAEQSVITKTGAVINTITDISGNGRTITPVTVTNKPADGTTFIDMETGYFTCDALASIFTGDDKPLTVIAYVKFQTTTVIRCVWNLGKNGLDNNFFAGWTTTTPNWVGTRKDGTTQKTFTSGTPLTTAYQLVVWHFNGQNLKVYINGSQIGVTTDLDVNSFTLDRFTIGSLGRTSYSNPINGYLKSFAVYSRALTDAELSKVFKYYGY